MLSNLIKSTSSLALVSTLALPAVSPAQSGGDPKSFGASLSVPVFEQIDQNGVDLLGGYLRIKSPTYTAGTEQAPVVLGLQWQGRGWVRIGVPSIWKDDGDYTVNYNGYSDEFDGFGKGFRKKHPVNGSKLECFRWRPSNLVAGCKYTSRDGDHLVFRSGLTPFTPTSNGIGLDRITTGNLAVARVSVDSVSNADSLFVLPGYPVFFGSSLQAYSGGNVVRGKISYITDPDTLSGSGSFPASNSEGYRGKRIVNIVGAGGRLKITTPNHDNDDDEHYLRPKNTTQTIEDASGNIWRYTVNGDREITRIDAPGGAADRTFTYTGQHRVRTVTTVDGVWDYSYSDNSTFRTVVRTDPLGNVTKVKYHKDGGYIVQFTDPLNRVTNYQYTDRRLTRITYPEGNYETFTYDARGNVTYKRTYGKPGSGVPTLVERAGYDATCSDPKKCNKPNYTIDANNRRTDFEYQNGLVTKITAPAPTSGAPRPQTRNTYDSNGVLTRSAFCKTQASCVGTADEVVTTYDYGGTANGRRILYGIAVTNAGQTLRTCYSYDSWGRRVSETTPRANLSSCPTGNVLGATTGSVLSPLTRAPSAPTYPDGTTGGGGGGGGSGGGNPNDPPFENCGPGTGIICQ